jgi:ABC-type sugar transport system substrate-binding protein
LKRFRGLAALATVAIGIAACGSSSSSTSSGGSGSSSATSAASAASSGSSSSSGGKLTPKPLTIGVIPSTSSSENLAIWIAQLKAAAAPLGWTVNVCNGNGVVTTMENCAESFVTQHVGAIVTMALGGPEIPQGFAEAKKAGIPVMAEGTSVTPGYQQDYTGGIYGDDIVKQGVTTAQYVCSNFKGEPVIGTQITQNYGGQGYVDGEVSGFKSCGDKFTQLRDTDLANIVNSLQSNVKAELQAVPGKAVLLGFDDIDPSLFQPVLQQAGRSKDVTEIVRYDDATTVGLMKQGDNILVVDTKDYQHIFDMLNALLAHQLHGTAFPPNSQTVNDPGAIVVSYKQYPAGSSRYYPFAPALAAQKAIWAKTYNLKSSSLTAP